MIDPPNPAPVQRGADDQSQNNDPGVSGGAPPGKRQVEVIEVGAGGSSKRGGGGGGARVSFEDAVVRKRSNGIAGAAK